MASIQSPYTHLDTIHNLESPRVIVPALLKHFNPKSVLDIGCGTGTFLRVFLDHGVHDITGVDGDWVAGSQLQIPESHFIRHNLQKALQLNRRFDLALCLEVAEHLEASAAPVLVESLCRHADLIIFSAAIPNQGGQNHLNEQPHGYWQALFAKHGYVFADVFRPMWWNDPRVQWWYKQNMFLVCKPEYVASLSITEGFGQSLQFSFVHPNLLAELAAEYRHSKPMSVAYKQIMNGERPLAFYLKLLATRIKVAFRRTHKQ